MQKKLTALFLMLCIILNFCGCTYKKQINEMAYCVVLLVDCNEEGKIFLGLGLANQSEQASSKDKEAKEEPLYIKGGGEDFFSAFDDAQSLCTKEISLAHTKILILSEKIAKRGVFDITDELMRSKQFRPNTLVCVTENPEEYSKSLARQGEGDVAKEIKTLFLDQNGKFIPKATVKDLYFSFFTDEKAYVLPYFYKEEDEERFECKMSVFKGDKQIMTGTKKECRSFCLLMGDFKTGFFSFQTEKGRITAMLEKRKPSKISVNLNEKNEAEIVVFLSADVLSAQANLSEKQIKDEIAACIEAQCGDFLEKIKEENADCIGFGAEAKKEFYTQQKWEEYNWEEKYEKLCVCVKADVFINSYGLIKKNE